MWSSRWSLWCVAGLILLLAACGASGYSSTPTNARLTQTPTSSRVTQVPPSSVTPDPGLPSGPFPPQLLEIWPDAGQEVSTDAILMLSFDQPMDQPSVEAAFALTPATSGTFTWISNRVVSFKPDSLLTGQRYLATLNGDVKSATGLGLDHDLESAFRTVSPLRVTRTVPADGDDEVWVDASILVEFNRPVVPTNCAGQAADGVDGCFALPLALSPAVSGHATWVDPSTYRFEPSPGLQAGQMIAATLEPTIISSDGAALLEPYTWSFKTAVPSVLTVSPDPDARDVPIDAAVWVHFSTPMDRVQTGGAFSVVDLDGQPISGSVTWLEDGTALVFTPTQRLDLEATYTAAIGSRARAATSAPLDRPYSWAFSTVRYPELLAHSPGDGDRGVDVHEPVRLMMAGEVDPEALAAAIQITPEPPDGALYTWYDDTADVVTLSWPRDPRTEICITVDPALADAYGNKVRVGEGFCFETGDLPPALDRVLPFNAVTLNASRPAQLRLLNLNVTSARFSLSRISLPQFVAPGTPSGDLVREWTASFQPELNVTEVVTVSLDPLDGLLPTGLYALTWQPVGQNQTPRTQRLAVVDRHILVKLAGEEALAWVTELGSGLPVSRTAVQLVDQDELLLAGGTLDADGLVALPVAARPELWEPVAAVTGQPGTPGFGIALTSWQGGVSPWEFGVELHTSVAPTYRAYLQLDRQIYRTGDTLRYAGVLRRDLAGQYEIPPGDTIVTLDLRNPSSESVYSTTAEISVGGLLSGSMVLPDDLYSGDYSIQVTVGSPTEEQNDLPLTSASFAVAAYRKPASRILITPDADTAVVGEPIRFTIESEYCSGGVVDAAPVDWILSALPYSPNADAQIGSWTMAGWHWGDGHGSGERITIARGSGVTDSDGRYVLEFEADAQSQISSLDGSQIWLLEAKVTDGAGVSVAGAAMVTLHQAEYILALRPQSWNARLGERNVVNIAVVDWHGVGVPGVEVALTLLNRVQLVPTAGAARPYTDTIISEETVLMDNDGLGTTSFRLPQSGSYVVAATVTDLAGRKITTELALQAGMEGGGQSPQLTPARLDLVPDRQQYSAGDTARILVPIAVDTPYRLLMTVEREGILWTRTYVLDRANPVIEVPIAGSYGPKAYVVCAVVVPETETSVAEVKVGYATLTVATEQQELRLEVQADRTNYEPGERARLAVSVTDSQGTPQRADVTVVVTDASVATLTSKVNPTLKETFYGPRPLRVVTGDGLLVAVDRAAGAGGEPQNAGEDVAGGPRGMGVEDGGNAPAGLDARGDVPDTAYYQTALSTDAEGLLELTLDLPDTLNTWEVRVWAVTPETRVGEATAALTVSKPLSIQPVIPQFLVAGDRAELAALVHNSTGQSLEVDVALRVDEPLRLESAATQQLVLAAGDRQRAVWTVTADPTRDGSAEVVFSAGSGQYSDASPPVLPALAERLLPVRALASREVTGVAGVLESASSRVHTVAVPQVSGPGSEVVVRVDTSLTSIVLAELGQEVHLATAHSTDAWVNALLPIVAARQALAATESLPIDLSVSEATAGSLLEQLYARQNPDGGWGWRQGDSNLHLTSYVVHGLMQAERAGLPIRTPPLARGLAYMHDWLNRGIESGLRYPYLAFALSVLAEAEQAWPQGAGAALYADRGEVGTAGRAYLALAFGTLDSSDTRLMSLLSELNSSAIVSGSGAHWQDFDPASWSTGVQSTALVLKVLARFAPDDPMLDMVVRWLATSRGTRAELTPYETAWVLSALADYVRIRGDAAAAYDWHVALNGTPVAEAGVADRTGQALIFRASDSGSSRLRVGQNVIEIGRSTGFGHLYYTALINTRLPLSLDAQGEQRGMTLSRQYCILEAESETLGLPELRQCRSAGVVEVGDLVEVRLTAVLPEQRHYLRIEDPFPAGFGPVLTEAQASPRGYDTGALGFPNLQEDLALFAAEHLTAGTYRASYLLRAVIPGLYHALPAVAEETYVPETWASTSVGVLEIVSP